MFCIFFIVCHCLFLRAAVCKHGQQYLNFAPFATLNNNFLEISSLSQENTTCQLRVEIISAMFNS